MAHSTDILSVYLSETMTHSTDIVTVYLSETMAHPTGIVTVYLNETYGPSKRDCSSSTKQNHGSPNGYRNFTVHCGKFGWLLPAQQAQEHCCIAIAISVCSIFLHNAVRLTGIFNVRTDVYACDCTRGL